MSFDETLHCLSASDQKIVGDIMNLLTGIDRQTEEFSKQSGLKCKTGCGACCENPEIETTVAEVLPLAVHLWAQRSGEGVLDAIQSNDAQGVCVFYQPDPIVKGKGRCKAYDYRPGLCRLFGFAAHQNKYGQQELLTCKVIKDSQSEACQRVQEQLQQGEITVPLFSAHSFAVANIDPVNGHKLFPINKAVSLAFEKIGFYIGHSPSSSDTDRIK